MNEFALVCIGKSVSTFGIKGELKVISDFKYLDKAYVIGRKILLNNREHTISSIRYHKQYILLGIDNLDNINDVLDYVGFNIYMKRSDLNLLSNEYLDEDLIDAQVIDDNEEVLGKVIEIVNNKMYNYVKVQDSKSFLIPLIDVYIVRFDSNNKLLYTKNARSLKLLEGDSCK